MTTIFMRPHSTFDSRYRSTNDDNDSRLGVEGGGRSIPLHQLDLQIVWQVNISRSMRWRTTQCYLATTKKSMVEVIGNKRIVRQLHAEGGSTPEFFFRAAWAFSYTVGWGFVNGWLGCGLPTTTHPSFTAPQWHRSIPIVLFGGGSTHRISTRATNPQPWATWEKKAKKSIKKGIK
jgi:hypothetical protein